MNKFYRTEDAVRALEVMQSIDMYQSHLQSVIKRNDLATAQEIIEQQSQMIEELVRLQNVYKQHKKLESIAKRMNALGIDMEVIIHERHTQSVL